MKYFESHAHYDDRRFREDREELLKELLPASGVSHIINIGCDVKSSEMSVRMADKYDYIYAAVGVHPHELYDMSSQTIEKLRKLSEHKKVVAIGEIGLDYHYDTHPREYQRFWFNVAELPQDREYVVEVRARNCYGRCSQPLVSKIWRGKPGLANADRS